MQIPLASTLLLFFTLVSTTPKADLADPAPPFPTVGAPPAPAKNMHSSISLSKAIAAGVNPTGAHPSDYVSADT
jgi:hypothetical protein